MEKGTFKGKFTTTRNASENDVYYEIMTALMKIFDYEKSGTDDLDYVLNWKERNLMIVNEVDAVFSSKMVRCEKVLFEPLTSRENIMKTYNINEDEWDKMIVFYPELDAREPIKRVYNYEMELEVSKPEYGEYMEIAINLLKEIS